MPVPSAIVAALLAASVHGQSPSLGHGGTLDLVRGPLITSSRIMGLGGAFCGVAEGIDGIFRNPAALANRTDTDTSWLELDVTLDWLIVKGSDMDWDGDMKSLPTDVDFTAVNFGLVAQLGPLGLGLLTTLYGWARAPDFSANHIDVLFGAGWAFDDGLLVLGAGADVSVVELKVTEVSAFTLVGFAGDVGLLFRPRALDWRLGARFRSEARLQDGESSVADTGVIPWQLSVGWSMFFPADPAHRYNPRLRSKTAPPVDRRYLLVSTELVLLGAATGKSFESLVGDTPRIAGRHPTLALHVGAEGEIFHDRVRARVGTYVEPVRVAGASPFRPHMTGGLEIHLFELLFDWKVNFAFDVAPRWQNITLGIGFWK